MASTSALRSSETQKPVVRRAQMNLILFHLDSAAHVRASVTRTGRSPSTTFAPTFGSDRALNAISCAGPCSNSRWESTLYTPSWGSGSGLNIADKAAHLLCFEEGDSELLPWCHAECICHLAQHPGVCHKKQWNLSSSPELEQLSWCQNLQGGKCLQEFKRALLIRKEGSQARK